jgi:hypothetical protein
MSEPKTAPESSPDRSPWSRSSVLLSGAFLLALMLLGIIVAVTADGGRHPGRPSQAAKAPTGPNVPAAAASRTGCHLPAGSQAIPAGSPPAARWGTVGSMQVPQNPAVYGPQRSSGPWQACFADDPAGALLAAINFYAESTTGEPEEAVMRRYAVGAPADLGSSAGLDSSGPVQLAGYRYGVYTPARAQVALVFTGPQGKQAAVVTSMVWRDGDWKYVFPSGGVPSYQVIPDLTGYVVWTDF